MRRTGAPRTVRHPSLPLQLSLLAGFSTLAVSSNALTICILSGSTRTSGPPRPILSERVTQYIESAVSKRCNSLDGVPLHDVSIVKARNSLPLLERPHFTYAPSQVPKELEEIHRKLSDADAYIVITPEYNHAPCPGLLNMMNHFGSSTFSFKPSGIVSYSAGQWGGTRAAHSLRPFLSELGCIPVSAMVHVPQAMDVFHENGCVIAADGSNDNEKEEERWDSYVDRMLSQLEWWGEAAKRHRDVVDPLKKSPAFSKSPSERNAPGGN